MIKRRWVADNSKNELIENLSLETGIDKTLIRILVNREVDNVKDIKEFLNPLFENLFDPFLLKDMDKAVKRIEEAIKKEETVVIYGDYDVDGVTASSILYVALKDKIKNLYSYIPDRESEGYGLNINAIDKIKDMNATLIITVDCGITSCKEALYAKSKGIDMIITDHHNCPSELPTCIGVINPKRSDADYPFRELCGAGVALKLCFALGIFDEKLIAIASIGTVADIVPLVSENRIIVYYGLKFIKENKLPNITKLMEISGIKPDDITSTTLSFAVAPRINAAGRMASAKYAFDFFVSEDDDKVTKLAIYLNNLNIKRQETEKNILNQVKSKINSNKEYNNKEILIVSGENWHEGVIGIVASKITEEYFKPCILISFNKGIGKGSTRSIKGFNIYDALSFSSEYLVKFGGHELAAGLTLTKENYEVFKEKTEDYAKTIFDKNRIKPELYIDCELKPEDMNEEFTEKLKLLEPYGMANPQPVFFLKNMSVVSSASFKEEQHMRLQLKKNSIQIEGIGFGMGSYANSLNENDKIHIAGTVGINEFRGFKKFQARIKDIRLS